MLQQETYKLATKFFVFLKSDITVDNVTLQRKIYLFILDNNTGDYKTIVIRFNSSSKSPLNRLQFIAVINY